MRLVEAVRLELCDQLTKLVLQPRYAPHEITLSILQCTTKLLVFRFSEGRFEPDVAGSSARVPRLGHTAAGSGSEQVRGVATEVMPRNVPAERHELTVRTFRNRDELDRTTRERDAFQRRVRAEVCITAVDGERAQ